MSGIPSPCRDGWGWEGWSRCWWFLCWWFLCQASRSAWLLAANAHDNASGVALLDQIAENACGTVEKTLVDQGFKNQVVAHRVGLGIDVETVVRNPQEMGFVRSRSGGGSSRPTES